MSSPTHRQSRRRMIWTAFLERTCFRASTSAAGYSSLSTDSLPLLSEKTPFYPTMDLPSPKERAISPPRLTRWPSASNLKTRRSVLNVSTHNVASSPPQDQRSIIKSFTPKPRSRSGSTPETELTDELSLMDTANFLGAVGGLVGAGYAGAAYHQQRRQGQEERMRDEDLEMGQRGGEEVRFGITVVENREPQQNVRHERVEVHTEERGAEDFVWTGMK